MTRGGATTGSPPSAGRWRWPKPSGSASWSSSPNTAAWCPAPREPLLPRPAPPLPGLVPRGVRRRNGRRLRRAAGRGQRYRAHRDPGGGRRGAQCACGALVGPPPGPPLHRALPAQVAGVCPGPVLVIALGIGANTAAFSVANFVLLKPLPFPESDQLVRLCEGPGGWGCNNQLSGLNYREFVARSVSFRSMDVFVNWLVILVGARK